MGGARGDSGINSTTRTGRSGTHTLLADNALFFFNQVAHFKHFYCRVRSAASPGSPADAAVCCSQWGFVTRFSANIIMDKLAALVREEKAIWHSSAATERGMEVGETPGMWSCRQNRHQIHGEDQSHRMAVPPARPTCGAQAWGRQPLGWTGRLKGLPKGKVPPKKHQRYFQV